MLITPTAEDRQRANNIKNMDARMLRNAYRELAAYTYALERAYRDVQKSSHCRVDNNPDSTGTKEL